MDQPNIPQAIRQALATGFDRIVVFSGAGMSADSGIPTFRSGSNGLWDQFNPEDLATPDAWERNRNLVWAWYEWRRGLVMAAQPNVGHQAAAELQRRFGAAVITQNVDHLHERGGASDVMHLHGSLFAARCDTCGQPHGLRRPLATALRELAPPNCTSCDGHVRPGVVWFGEGLNPEVVARAREAISGCHLLLVVGTSGVVAPAASMVAWAPPGATIIEINPQPSAAVRDSRLVWATTAAIGMPLLVDALKARATAGG